MTLQLKERKDPNFMTLMTPTPLLYPIETYNT